MKGWKYPPAVERLFRRNPDGTVEVVYVKGDRPSSDPFYAKASCDAEAKEKAKRQLRIDGEGHIWWVFLYVGDRPKRFSGWEGGGCSRDGGGAIVNYDTIPGEIRPDLNPASGFNGEYFLKGTIHELGHAFGLPHIGPDPSLGLGNSLMGPNNDVYAERKYPNADRRYLTEASAAMLWKHPVFSGTAKDRQRQPAVKLVDYKPAYGKKSDRITLAGKVVADMPAHSVVVLDDLGKPDDEYWNRSHVARVGPDGTFRVADRQARPAPAATSGSCSASTTAWSPATARASSSATTARSSSRTSSATAPTGSAIERRVPRVRSLRTRGTLRVVSVLVGADDLTTLRGRDRCQARRLTVSLMYLTEPSHIATLTPPECRLRAAKYERPSDPAGNTAGLQRTPGPVGFGHWRVTRSAIFEFGVVQASKPWPPTETIVSAIGPSQPAESGGLTTSLHIIVLLVPSRIVGMFETLPIEKGAPPNLTATPVIWSIWVLSWP